MNTTQLRRKLTKLLPVGAELTDTTEAYTAVAPPRTRWDGDVHEFVSPYWVCGSVQPGARADALLALFERIAEAMEHGGPQPCVGPCDWCADQ